MPIFIGYDPRESIAYQIAKFSIERRATIPVDIRPLEINTLRAQGLYTRPSFIEGLSGQTIDAIDGRPYSSEFTFTRFLVPELARLEGYSDWVMFVDPDFLFLEDIANMMIHTKKGDYDIMCVKHKFNGTTSTKLDNKVQSGYPRKLWSSMFLFNLKGEYRFPNVNSTPGRDLHAFKGCPDHLIGSIPEDWNHIPGHSKCRSPAAIHYTEFSPWFPSQENCAMGDLWWKEMEAYQKTITLKKKKEIWW